MNPELRHLRIEDPDRHTTLLLAYPTPDKDNPWGVLEPLRETSWGKQIPTVSGEALSHALHGRVRPLRLQLGHPPLRVAQQVPLPERQCYSCSWCGLVGPSCAPGSGSLPECYEAPTKDRGLRLIASVVAKAWDEGRYVFVVSGPEFVI